MSQRPRTRTSRTGPVLIGLIVFLAVLLGGGWLWMDRRPPPPPAPAPPAPEPSDRPAAAPEPAPPASPRRPVLRYEAENERFQELMDERKAEVGLEKSVDMIVREDETIRVGDHTLSMSDILNDIRLGRGEVVEESLTGARDTARRARRLERLYERLRAAEQEFWSLEQALADPATDPATLPEKARRQEELAGTVTDFQRYKETLSKLDALRDLLKRPDPAAATEERIADLGARRDAVEARLRQALAALGETPPPGDEAALTAAMDRLERRYWEIETTLRAPDAPVDPDRFRELAAERTRLRDAVAAYQEYKALRDRIAALEAIPPAEGARKALESQIDALADRRDELEGRLMADVLSEEPASLFGIHVVRPGDNIWNIHFQFLREYFGGRNIRIAPAADEPDDRGLSSGVGKILKFSETMVHIYNLRERRVEGDLDLIHPESKIVVFNLSEAFDLLSRIDRQNIRRLRFDGETLWIPAG
jgi:hypothetical protein